MRKQNGITLIALIITIIVLLILAGVSIAMLSGENGILTKATSAREKNVQAGEQEKIELAMTAAIMDDGQFDENVFVSELDNSFGTGNYTQTGDAENGYSIEVGKNTYTASPKDGVEFIGSNDQAKIVEPVNIDDWEYALDSDNNTITITEYKGADTEVVIPNHINGVPVVAIGDGSNKIWSDEICESVNFISDNYTYAQTTITKITISEGIESINSYAFYNSSALSEVILPSTLTTIEDYAFSFIISRINTSPIYLEIPSTTTSVGTHIFNYNKSSVTVKVPFAEGNQPAGWDSEWNMISIYGGSSTEANVVYAENK